MYKLKGGLPNKGGPPAEDWKKIIMGPIKSGGPPSSENPKSAKGGPLLIGTWEYGQPKL